MGVSNKDPIVANEEHIVSYLRTHHELRSAGAHPSRPLPKKPRAGNAIGADHRWVKIEIMTYNGDYSKR